LRIPGQSGHLVHLIPDTPQFVIEAALDNQPISHYFPKETLRRDSWLKVDYLWAKSKRFFDFTMKKGLRPGKLPRA
jgi:hypothetical protein